MSEPAPSQRVMLILWAAMLNSHVILGAVSWFISVPSESQPELVLYVLTAAGLALPAMVAPTLTRMLSTSARAQGPMTFGKLMPVFIVGLAVREAGAVMAMLIMIMFHEPLYWAVVAGVAFASTVVSYPSPSWIDEQLGQTRSRRGLQA